MLKKGIVLSLVCMLLLCMVPQVFAQETLTGTGSFSRETTQLTISGSVTGTEAGERVTLIVLKPGYSFDALTSAAGFEAALCRTDETTVGADGSFSFTPAILTDAHSMGDCYWRISVAGLVYTGSFYYSPLGQIKTILNTLNSKAATEIYDYLVTDSNASPLQLPAAELEVYKTLAADGERAYVEQALAAADYSVANTATEAEVNSKLATLATDFKNLVALGLLNDSQNAAEVTAAIAAYNDFYLIDETYDGLFDGYTAEKKAAAVTALYQRVAAAERFAAFAEIAPFVKEKAVLVALEYTDWGGVDAILTGQNSVLGLDLTAYNGLSVYAKDQVATALAGKSYADVTALQTAFTTAVANNTGGSTTTTTGGGRGSSSRGSSSHVASSVLIDVTTEGAAVSRPTTGFTDLGSVPWAVESIMGLYERGVVNGRTATTFAPLESLTRAEFVKMLVLAFGEDAAAADVSFTDAEPDAWYYPYLAKSVSMELITGYEDGRFGVNDPISRQDMAVILYRLLLSENPGLASGMASDFNDQADIAEYAREAALVLRAREVFGGDEQGNFLPRKTAGRAEAAKVVWGLVALLS